jgi:hypothetical protein
MLVCKSSEYTLVRSFPRGGITFTLTEKPKSLSFKSMELLVLVASVTGSGLVLGVVEIISLRYVFH